MHYYIVVFAFNKPNQMKLFHYIDDSGTLIFTEDWNKATKYLIDYTSIDVVHTKLKFLQRSFCNCFFGILIK